MSRSAAPSPVLSSATVTDAASRAFVALDTRDSDQALAWARAVVPPLGGVKLGMEFFTANGPDGVRRIVDLGAPVFLDLKFHDIPNTVAGAARGAVALGVSLFNIHASGGRAMLQAALDASGEEASRLGRPRPALIAVTALTSLDDHDLADIGVAGNAADMVVRLATLTRDCGLDGVVCSPHEAVDLRRRLGPDFLLVTPGVRPDWAAVQDQKRHVTPAAAVAAGADRIVVGRPVTQAGDVAQAAARVAADMRAGV
ncbi:MAG: orotidine-5'-phosphate decarboxylase [Alphaproteobacteria bacterium]